MILGGGKATLTGGFYYSQQDIDTAWLWTSHLMTVEGNGNAVLLDVRNAAGVPQTQNGTVGYSAAFFGNCCRRSYDLKYTTKAPFASLGLEFGGLSLDGSVRFFGLTPTSIKLEGLDRHLRLIDSYKKLHTARGGSLTTAR